MLNIFLISCNDLEFTNNETKSDGIPINFVRFNLNIDNGFHATLIIEEEDTVTIDIDGNSYNIIPFINDDGSIKIKFDYISDYDIQNEEIKIKEGKNTITRDVGGSFKLNGLGPNIELKIEEVIRMDSENYFNDNPLFKSFKKQSRCCVTCTSGRYTITVCGCAVEADCGSCCAGACC